MMLAPAGWLPERLAVIIGTLLPIVALTYTSWKVRKPYMIALVGLTFPFMELCIWGNLDWMPMLGMLSINALSPFLLAVKPQAGALAAVGYLGSLRGKNWKEYVRVFGPVIVIGIPLLFLYPGFLHNLFVVNNRLPNISNFSLFPYTIPLAVPLLWLSYRRADPLYGALASLCVAPYFYFHSIIPSLFLIADRSWKWGVAVNVLTWVIFALIFLKVIPITL